MKLSPELALEDLEQYLLQHKLCLTDRSKQLILNIEIRAKNANRDLYPYVVLPVFMDTIEGLSSAIIKGGGDPNKAVDILDKACRESQDDRYDDNLPPYSDSKYRSGCREILIDFAMNIARREKRSNITEYDIFEGYLDSHDQYTPATENGLFYDERMKVPYNTLCHIHGQYDKALWVKFDDIRAELHLGNPSTIRQTPIATAPSHLKPSVTAFIADNPDYRKNCFLIMPFRETDFHSIVHAELKDLFSELGFHLHRADDKEYTNDVFTNIETYIHGCKFGIALHERVISDDHNPNVSLEIGYMLGQKKEVCLLKEKTVQRLPSDLQGRLYVEFDGFNIKGTLRERVRKWLSDKHLIRKLQSEFA